jgi:transposase InsO family protein
MRIRSTLKGTTGWLYMRERSIRFRYMITEKAKERAKILTFWKKYGAQAVEEAYGVKFRTLYIWQKKLKEGNGKIEALNQGARAPKKRRTRLWDPRILEELKRIRFEHPNLGKDKLHPPLQKFCLEKNLECPSVRTIGRLIRDAGGLRMVPLRITGTGRVKPLVRTPALRKPKDMIATYPGHVVALDTFEEHINGTRRYVITFIDLYTRFGFAFATSSHASLAAADFFSLCRSVFPFPFTNVLTDNGSEFKKNFAQAVSDLHLTHYHTRPRTPKQNAHSERFNRTVQEEFADYHRNDLWLDLETFNRKLFEWLYWYNTERVHFAFGNKLTPIGFMLSLDPSTLPAECKSGWPHTLC